MTYAEQCLAEIVLLLAERFADALVTALESGAGDESDAWRFAVAAHRLVESAAVVFINVDA